MKTAGIICEYNPIHNGHVRHIAETRALLGEDCAIICVMSGNFVQRGDFAIFEKHARAESAVLCGADLVLELPLPTVLSSAEGFARGGVALLNALGVCSHLSFGSETGETESLSELADCLLGDDVSGLIKEELKAGVSYAHARQRAAERVIGQKANVLKTPNNILGVEYLKALKETNSCMEALTIRRIGAAHDSDGAESASALRKLLREGEKPWRLMPRAAAAVLKNELASGRGPVFLETVETAVLSRLRSMCAEDFARLPDASEGLDLRLMRFAQAEPTIQAILEKTKTKRYALSRLRRMLLCAVLGIRDEDKQVTPRYIRVLAMNKKGTALLREIKLKSALPVITKPAEVKTLDAAAQASFDLDAASTDFFVLAYPVSNNRTGGQEWRLSPRMI